MISFRRSARSLTLVVALALHACGGGGGNGGPPTGPPVDGNPYDGTGVVGPAGGSVALGDGISIDVPAGALPEETVITISRVATPPDLQAQNAIGQAYRIEPVDVSLSAAARVSIFVPDAILGGRPLSVVTILRSTGAGSDLAPAGDPLGGVQRTEGGIVSGQTTMFGTFSAALTETNRAPTVNAGADQTVEVETSVTVTASGNDPDGDPLSYSWTVQSRPSGSTASLSNASTASASITPDVAGTYVLRVTVSDGNGGTATDTVEITAEEPQPSGEVTADAGPDQSGTVGSTVQLDGSGSTGPPGATLIYAWQLVSGPASVSITNATRARASFTPSTAGTYVFRLTVTDGTSVDQDTVTVTVVQPNRAPTLDVTAPPAVFLNTQATLTATTSDPDGDPVQVNFTLSAPSGSSATLQVNGNQATFTPDVPGAYTVNVTASDGSTQTGLAVTVYGNPNVAGTYTTKFQVTSVSGDCGGFINNGDNTTADMRVSQPTPGNVVLHLSDFDNLSNDASGVLQGLSYSYSGGLTFTDGTNSVTANGTITGTFSTSPMGLNLTARFSVLTCSATATMTSPPS